jgi:hypothetical protein|tara:strand:- start:71 stop:460 length:390 start_codon:yes stop_codon:yes gene_type:complete
MKVKITYIILKKDINARVTDDSHLKVYLDDNYSFPFRYISTKSEYETLKEISDKHLNIEFDWIKKDLFSFEVLDNQECEVVYLGYVPHVSDAEKTGSFYSLRELSDIGIDLKTNYERAIFRRGKSTIAR